MCRRRAELNYRQGAAYVHMTSNNTIFGTEFPYVPDTSGAPLVCDASSDIFSRPIDVSKFGLIYAGAQKNLGPSGVTVVIVREDLLARSTDALPSMLNYKLMAENASLYNTPPAFGIYVLGLVLKWLRDWAGCRRLPRSTTARRRRCTTNSTAPTTGARMPTPTAGRP